MTAELTYHAVGATSPGEPTWTTHPARTRCLESTVRLGVGPECWEWASSEVLRWGIKTRSGFDVRPADGGDPAVRVGAGYRLTARVGPLRVREPVQVVAVVRDDDRAGFAYGTLAGHPVSGEEAFVVHRGRSDEVMLTLRSFTAPGAGPWRLVYPGLLVAQQVYRRRYGRALRCGG